MAIDWKESSPKPASPGKENPWFAISVGLIGLIAGYALASYFA